ncbi:MAG: sigma factor-like helix-turn-helix DNA-binding protein [Anaerolineales bacterium]|nr:MAG: sigma factor-like helix-turn-helix DNA-binding protein [Anaerolineales bacterium]
MPSDFAELLNSVLETYLSERERRIFNLRYGLSSGKAMTLDLVGKEIGVTRERIRQILDRCHKKLFSKRRLALYSGMAESPISLMMKSLIGKISFGEDYEIASRAVDFIEEELPFLSIDNMTLTLVVRFLYSDKRTKEIVSQSSAILKERRRSQKRAYSKQKISREFQLLLDNAFWADTTRIFSISEISKFSKSRNTSSSGVGKAGAFYSKKLKRGVEYESELELDFYHDLEANDDVVYYQEQPLAISYSNDGNEYKYHPDVLLILGNGRGVIVEIKPVFQMALNINLKKWVSMRSYCSENGLGFLITDGKHVIREFYKIPVAPEFANEVLSSLQIKPMYWSDYKLIQEKYKPKRDEFVGLILQKRLIWRLSPFTLSLSDESG